MFRAAKLAQVKVSVREQQLKQRWRMWLLWVLRIVTVALLLLILRAATTRPFEDIDGALDRCLQEPLGKARVCMRQEVEVRRLAVQGVRDQVLGLIALTALTLAVSLMVRFSLHRRLREERSLADQVFDAVPLPLSMRTPDGIYLRVNTEFERRFGMKESEVVGKHYSQVFSGKTVEIVTEMDQRALASTGPVEIEVDLSEAGKPLHAIQRFQAVRDEDGDVLGIVIIRDDITDLRVSNERLRRASAQMIDAQEEERRRIARDLHDQVGQILTALKMQLGLLQKHGVSPDAAAPLMLARDFAEEALRHTRDLSASLHPHLLDDLGMEPALNWLIDRFVRPLATVDLRCRLTPPRGPQDIELVAFRVVQEALTNAARHAQATRIGVIVESSGADITIEVIDDGVGYDEAQTRPGTSLGLTAMNDRVTDFGGELVVESTPGLGTRVRARLPWVREELPA